MFIQWSFIIHIRKDRDNQLFQSILFVFYCVLFAVNYPAQFYPAQLLSEQW